MFCPHVYAYKLSGSMGKKPVNHIALVTTSFPDEAFQPGQEAAGAFVADFASELATQIRVTVVAPGSRDGREQIGNLTIHSFAVPSLPLSLLKPTNPKHWLAIVKTLRAGQSALNTTVAESSIDHIFALWVLPSGYWARQTSKREGIPYSVWALGSDIWTLGKAPVFRNVLRTVLRDSSYRFADGYQLATDVDRIGGLGCAFLPSVRKLPTTPDKTLASSPPYKLAFLGRWHPNKGIDLLLESLMLLTNGDWERILEVRIYGGGPLAEWVETQAKKLQQIGRPVIIGNYLDREKAAALYHWADYLLLPSRIESIPVVFSDAMQKQCPVIAMPVGDLPRLITRYKIGLVATIVTASAFTAALQEALNYRPISFATGLTAARADFRISTAAGQFLSHIL
jgi:glycosyltransferase involved in cell wall biosynthesis